jgi:hypothetical protein
MWTVIIARLSTDTTLASAGEGTKVPLTEITDTNNEFSDSSFKPVTSGTYMIQAHMYASSATNGTAYVTLHFLKNGSCTAGHSPYDITGNYSYVTAYAMAIVSMTSSDTLSVYGLGNSTVLGTGYTGFGFFYITQVRSG